MQSDSRRARSSKPKSTNQALARLLALGGVLVSCAVPGQPYRVAPSISGTLHYRDGAALVPESDLGRGANLASNPADAELRLRIIHRENPTLFDVQRIPAPADAGEFRFRPVDLPIAGREYSKFYRVYLHLADETSGGEGTTNRVADGSSARISDGGSRVDRVIWRGEFSRLEASSPVLLDCDLARPPRLGQPCQVRYPLRHAWLIDAGARSFERLCARCHAPKTLAQSGAEKDAVRQRIAPDLSRISARHAGEFDRSWIAARIEGTANPPEHGPSEMPVWGERLSEEYARYQNADELVGATLDPLLVYLLSIQR